MARPDYEAAAERIYKRACGLFTGLDPVGVRTVFVDGIIYTVPIAEIDPSGNMNPTVLVKYLKLFGQGEFKRNSEKVERLSREREKLEGGE